MRSPRERGASGVQAERRVAVGDQQEGIRRDAVVPPEHALDEVKQRPRVTTREEDRKPGDDGGDQRTDREEEEHDVVRDREEPLDQRQASAEVLLSVGVWEIEV